MVEIVLVGFVVVPEQKETGWVLFGEDIEGERR